MDFVWTWLREHLDNTDYMTPTVITIVSCVIVYMVFFRDKHWTIKCVKTVVFLSYAGFILVTFTYFKWKHSVLYVIAGLLFATPLLTLLITQIMIRWQFKKVSTLADSQSIRFNEVVALYLLDSMSSNWMTSKQDNKHKRYRLNILTHLGSLRTAETILENLKSDKAYYYFIQHFLAFSSGDMETANLAIQKAEDAQERNTDPLVKVQILLNHGVSYVTTQNYQAADDNFRKAANFYKKNKIKNDDLLFHIYYNYVHNKMRINNTTKPGEACNAVSSIIEEYKSQINLRKHNNQINLFNLELEILRQTKTQREEVDGFVQAAFDKFQGGKLPLENKIIFAAHASRIVWSARLNPEPCLKFIDENFDILNRLTPEIRYYALFDLSLLFEDLHGDIVNQYSKLRNSTRDYILYQAQNDLESWRGALPNEAVHQRCACLKALAGHQRKKPGYDYEKALSYLYSSIDLYRENHLYVCEHLCRLAVIDELCAFENLDRNYEPLVPDEMRKQCEAVEAFIPKLVQHPAISEFYLRLSFYCLILNEYGKCVEYYSSFHKSNLSLNHFAPWLHRYCMLAGFSVRILYFYKTIERIRKSKALNKYDNETRNWFESFPNHDGVLDSMLIGRFVGFGTTVYPIKMKHWLPKTSEFSRLHAWFCFQEINLNVDITHSQFMDDDRSSILFFNADKHPFETNESLTIASSMIETGLASPCMIQLMSIEELPQGLRELFDKLYKVICSQIPEDCPQLEELQQLFETTMLPVPAIGEEVIGVEP